MAYHAARWATMRGLAVLTSQTGDRTGTQDDSDSKDFGWRTGADNLGNACKTWLVRWGLRRVGAIPVGWPSTL